MKVTSNALLVLATSSSALAGSWNDWLPFKDATVTETLTRITQVCPCNGEVRVTPAHAATKPVKPEDVTRYTVTGAINPEYKQPLTVTKAGPIVVVFTTAGTLTTKTGIKLELKPTSGAVITKTVWTGPQPTDNLEWVDWDAEDDSNGGTLTRSHTKTVTVIGPAPTGTETEPWADWVAPTNTRSRTRTYSSSTTSRGVGPIPGSTTSPGWSHSTSTTSSSSVAGPGEGTTSSSSSDVGPGEGTTSTFSTTSSMTTTTSFSSSVDPGEQSTSSSSSEDAVTSSSSSSSADAVTSSSSSSSADAVTSSSSSSEAAVTSSSSSSSEDAVTSTSSVIDDITTTTTPPTTTTTPVTTTTTSPPASGSTVIADVRGLDYITAIIQQHNVHRANHSAADLVWSADLATIAGQTAASCVYAHDVTTGGGGYGQNIGAGYTPNQAGVMITNDMYNGEIGYYPGPYDTDNIDLTNFGRFGHFTQIVWKGTQNVGCATQYCPNGLVNAEFTNWFTVCNYSPPGNIRGAYANVGAPLGGPTVVVIANPN